MVLVTSPSSHRAIRMMARVINIKCVPFELIWLSFCQDREDVAARLWGAGNNARGPAELKLPGRFLDPGARSFDIPADAADGVATGAKENPEGRRQEEKDDALG